MLKLVLTILTAVLLTIFAMDNMQHVAIGFIIGSPVKIRLFFLLLTTFLVGFLTATIMAAYWQINAAGKKQTEKPDKENDPHFSDTVLNNRD